jgi:hypothetical protein
MTDEELAGIEARVKMATPVLTQHGPYALLANVEELVAEVRRLRHALTGIVIMPSRSSDGFLYRPQEIAQAMRDVAHKALDADKILQDGVS